MDSQIAFALSCLVSAAQGFLSFASPCVLPLLPVYLSYFSVGGKKTALNSFLFALGIAASFFSLGLGASFLGNFLSRNRPFFMVLGGVLVVFFGFIQLGFLGSVFQKEKRIQFDASKSKSSPASAFLLGFFFSFSWTPCVGPALASVLVMSANAGTKTRGMFLIFCYTAGFAIPFVIAGIFVSSILNFFKNHKKIVKWTEKIGGIILVLAGIFMIAGGIRSVNQNHKKNENAENAESTENFESESKENSKFPPPADFSLFDQNGMQWTLSQLKGKIVILNFWATWCPPCRQEMPFFQEAYDELLDSGNDDVFILGVASPNFYREKDMPDIVKFLRANGYSYPCLMDFDGNVSGDYFVSAYPTTYLIGRDGKTQNVIIGAVTKERLEKLVSEAE